MTTDDAMKYVDSHVEIFTAMMWEFDDDIFSLAEEIEEFFLGNFDLLGKNSYPDFEEIAIFLVENYG